MKQSSSSPSKGPILLCIGFAFLCLLPMMALRDFSPSNELRYLSIADEALADGHIFAFYNQGLVYADKPPLYIWLIMLLRLILGQHSMLAICMLSFIPAAVIAVVMDRWVSRESSGERMALTLMLFTSLMFLSQMAFARMDMLMLMFIVLALNSFRLLYKEEGNVRLQRILLPVWIFLALFTKGPVGVLMPPVTILCFLIVRGRLRNVGKYLGFRTFGILAALCAVWFSLTYLEGGKEYLDNLLFHQTVGRAVNAFHHKEPFWYYLTAVWYVIAPYCLLLVGALLTSIFHTKGRRRSDDEVLFATAIIAPFVMLSAFSSKLSIYLLPVVPFFVYLFPVVKDRTGYRRWMDWALGIMAGILSLAGLALLVARVFFWDSDFIKDALAPYSFVGSPLIIAAAGLLFACNFAAVLHLTRSRWDKAVFCMASSLLLTVLAVSPLMPQINLWSGYAAVCKEVPSQGEVLTWQVHRPENMDVYLHRDIVDCEKDTDAVLSHSRPYTLIVDASKAKKDPRMEAFVEENESKTVGPMMVVEVK